MTDKAKVVGMHGQPIADPREPDEYAIKVAARVLELARSGEIKGLVVAYLFYDDTTGAHRGGQVSYGLIGRMELLKRDLLNDLAK